MQNVTATRDEIKALQAFRRSPQATLLRPLLERQLAAAREAYELQSVTEEQRLQVVEARTVLDTLFNHNFVLGG